MEQIVAEFCELVQIDSGSGREGAIARSRGREASRWGLPWKGTRRGSALAARRATSSPSSWGGTAHPT